MSKPKTPPPATLAGNLLRLRKAAGLTQRALSDASGLTEMLVSRIERGHENVEWKTLSALARGLGVSVIELIPEGE
jgi:transcriptional regulator with XRE-family HTH domain